MARLEIKDGKPEETEKVMQLIVYSFDTNTGINWDVVRGAVELITGGVK